VWYLACSQPLDWSEEDDMANDRYPMRERNPVRDDDDIVRGPEEDIVGASDDEDFEDIDELEEDDEDLEA
jgi:hypothetical protein